MHMTDYMTELRSKIGHAPIIMVGATLLALNPVGQLLMLRRKDNGFWGVPGGAMELNETFEDTLRRESKEQIGVDINEIEFFGLYSGPKFHYVYPNGDEVYIVTAAYITRLSGDEQIDIGHEEHSGYHFFDLNALPPDISLPIWPILQDLLKRQ